MLEYLLYEKTEFYVSFLLHKQLHCGRKQRIFAFKHKAYLLEKQVYLVLWGLLQCFQCVQFQNFDGGLVIYLQHFSAFLCPHPSYLLNKIVESEVINHNLHLHRYSSI